MRCKFALHCCFDNAMMNILSVCIRTFDSWRLRFHLLRQLQARSTFRLALLASCSDHKCPDAVAKDQRAAVCPMCKKTFALVGEGNDESISILWNRHISSGCTGRSQKPRCPVKGCKEKLTELNTFDCKKCKQKVCMKHRFEDAHLCQEAQKQSSRSRYNFWSSSSASTKPSAQASKADAPKSTGNGKWPCGRCGQCSKCEASKGGVGDQWACPACTLSNPANGMKCGACGAARPSTGATAPRESRREWKCTRYVQLVKLAFALPPPIRFSATAGFT
eukprot:GEMP01079005.1.p1 GENE.GEMP01079005.1~~GEMP01079005.1.p1  ORF type:complete len:277 (+),score=20.13 GEMP01079005.1:46-876(+)